MSLDTDIQNIVQQVFASMSDFRTAITYTSKSVSYNIATGQVTDSDTAYSVNAILTKYSQRDIDGITVHANDRKVLIPVNDLTPVPVLKDQIIIVNIVWNVIGIQQDPVAALWILQIRR